MGSLGQGKAYSGVPTFSGDTQGWIKEIAIAVNALIQGRAMNTGSVTLTANSATTTLTDPRIGGNSTINFMPTTANAAGALSGLYVSGLLKGSCTLNHANNAQVDKTFSYTVIG